MRAIETIACEPHDSIIAKLQASAPSAIELAREFYRTRLSQAFRYSRRMLANAGRQYDPSAVVDTPEVEQLLPNATPGTFDSARRVGEQAVVRMWGMDPTDAARPAQWWRDLLDYEATFHLQIATAEPAKPMNRPQRSAAASSRQYKWDLPMLLEMLNSGSAPGAKFAPTKEMEQPRTLLFSLDGKNTVNIMEIDAQTATVFRLANGMRVMEEIASGAGFSLEVTGRILNEMAAVGAIVPPSF